MEEFVMYHVVSIIQMLVFTIYLKELLGLRRSVWWMIVGWSGLVIGNIAITSVTESVVINGITYVMMLEAIAFWMCNGSCRKKLLLTLIYYILNALMEIVLVGIMMLFSKASIDMITENDKIANILIILGQILLFIIVQIVAKFWKKQLSYEMSIKNWFGTFLVSVGCFISVFILTIEMVETNNFSTRLVFLLCVWVWVSFFCYYFYSISAEKNRMELETQIYQKQISMYQEWYEGIQYARNEMRSFRHDMNNHFSILKSFCRKGIQDHQPEQHFYEIEKYIDRIGVKSYEMIFNTDSGNLVLDSIIDLKKSYALSKGITIKEQLHIPRNMKYENVDAIILLGNLLDNAIEACETLGKQCEIILKMQYTKPNLMITIENPYDGHIDGKAGEITESQTWKTTKEDASEHGIGMRNITTIIKKYDGMAQWKAEQGIFRIEILLYEFVLEK